MNFFKAARDISENSYHILTGPTEVPSKALHGGENGAKLLSYILGLRSLLNFSFDQMSAYMANIAIIFHIYFSALHRARDRPN
jgi:hypothetical protein